MRRTLAQGLAIALLIAGTGAAQGPNNSEATPAPVSSARKKPENKKTQPFQVGTASWYGSDFDGRLTASGEPYDMYEMTAAHLTLPLGSYVRVTNLHNGKTVVVRVNDRGPVTPGRIIDLSYGAALALGYNSRGLQRVRLDVVKPNRQRAPYQTVADNRPVPAIPSR